ncbi:hypothetical protein [Streptomyces sp. NPDC005827]|uniref:hypothetical protein n=1 Tax=Streptomyces sp. NPDC005827 TaxID=3157070 RepID=UPI0033E6214A
MVAVLALTACGVLAWSTSLLAVSEWITDAPPRILERLGRRSGGCGPASSAMRRTGRSDSGSPADARKRPGCAVSQVGRTSGSACRLMDDGGSSRNGRDESATNLFA